MARFDFDKELPLSKNELIYQSVLSQLLGDCSPVQLLQEPGQVNLLNQNFYNLVRQYPLDIDPHMRRAAAFGGVSKLLRDNCFMYIGEHDVLLERHDRYFPTGMHTHNFLELLCLVHGSCHHIIGGHYSQLQAGDIVCIPPGTEHCFTSFTDDCIIYNLSIRLDDFEARFYKLLQLQNEFSNFLQNIYSNQSNAWALFHSGAYLQGENILASIWQVQEENTELCPALLNVLTELLLLQLLNICSDRMEVHLGGSASGTTIEQSILTYIQLRFRTVTLTELSEVFSYSDRHISRILRQVTGMTLGEYLQQLRLEHIAHLLANTKVKIADAFEQAGVRNRSYFYKIFRNRFGMTPIEYRAAHGSALEAEAE